MTFVSLNTRSASIVLIWGGNYFMDLDDVK